MECNHGGHLLAHMMSLKNANQPWYTLSIIYGRAHPAFRHRKGNKSKTMQGSTKPIRGMLCLVRHDYPQFHDIEQFCDLCHLDIK